MPFRRRWQYPVLSRPVPQAITITWWRPLSEPFLNKNDARSRSALMAPFLAYPYQTIVELTLVTKWFRPFSEPVRTPPRLGAALNPSLFWVQASFGESPDYPKWGYAWSEPVRFKRDPRANVSLMASGPYFPVNPNPETIFVTDWFQPLSERLYSKPGLRPDMQQSTAYLNNTPTLPTPYSFGTIII